MAPPSACLPEAAAARPKIDDVGVAGMDGDRGDDAVVVSLSGVDRARADRFPDRPGDAHRAPPFALSPAGRPGGRWPDSGCVMSSSPRSGGSSGGLLRSVGAAAVAPEAAATALRRGRTRRELEARRLPTAAAHSRRGYPKASSSVLHRRWFRCHGRTDCSDPRACLPLGSRSGSGVVRRVVRGMRSSSTDHGDDENLPQRQTATDVPTREDHERGDAPAIPKRPKRSSAAMDFPAPGTHGTRRVCWSPARATCSRDRRHSCSHDGSGRRQRRRRDRPRQA